MRNESVMMFTTGAFAGLLGSLAVLAEVDGVAAVLCSIVFAIAAACLFTGWRFYARSPLARFRGERSIKMPLRDR